MEGVAGSSAEIIKFAVNSDVNSMLTIYNSYVRSGSTILSGSTMYVDNNSTRSLQFLGTGDKDAFVFRSGAGGAYGSDIVSWLQYDRTDANNFDLNFWGSPDGSASQKNMLQLRYRSNVGSVAINEATGTASLNIPASTTSSAAINLMSGTAPTSPNNGDIWYSSNQFNFRDGGVTYVLSKELKGSATLDFASTAAGAVTDLTITVTGAADGDVVSLSVPNASQTTTGSFSAWVSATNTVTVRYRIAALVGAEDPASGVFKVPVTK